MADKQEQNEINLLLNKGFKIEVKHIVKKYGEGLAGFFQPARDEEVTTVLEFKEPTLAVLDLVTEQYLKLNIYEPGKDAANGEVIANAHRTVNENARGMARIIAIFALGERAFQKIGDSYEINESEIHRLTEIIFHWATPGKLEKIISLCMALSNLPGFLTSIRLTGASRTTMPADLVE